MLYRSYQGDMVELCFVILIQNIPDQDGLTSHASVFMTERVNIALDVD